MYDEQPRTIEPIKMAAIMATENCSMQDCCDAAKCIRDLHDNNERLRKILACVPARVAIEAKEKAGFADHVVTMARPSTGHPVNVTEYRCNICGGVVRLDGTPPAIKYSPERGGKR